MNAVVIEHVKVAELPEAWRNKLAIPADAHVTVRIEDEGPNQQTQTGTEQDLLFGMWRDREDMADVQAYIRQLRAPRYRRDHARNDDQDKD